MTVRAPRNWNSVGSKWSQTEWKRWNKKCRDIKAASIARDKAEQKKSTEK